MLQPSAHDFLIEIGYKCGFLRFDDSGKIVYMYFHYKMGQFIGDFTKTTMEDFYKIHPNFKQLFQSLTTKNNPMSTTFKKAQALFTKYGNLQDEIERLEIRLKVGNFAEVLSSEFVQVDVDLIHELVLKVLKYKYEELEILQKDFEELIKKEIKHYLETTVAPTPQKWEP